MEKSFILLTCKDDNTKVLYSINDIVSFFVDNDGSTFVEADRDSDGEILGFNVVETLDQILTMLNERGLAICY